MCKPSKSPIKAGWQDVLFAFRSLAEAFKDNINLDSLLLLYDGLWKEKGPIYGIEKQTLHLLFFMVKKVKPQVILFIMKLYTEQAAMFLKICVPKECKGTICFYERYANALNSSTPYLSRLQTSDLHFPLY